MLTRKLFVSCLAAACLLLASAAQALTILPYSAQAFTKAQASGKPVAVAFHASWCPTCRAQDMVFKQFKNDPDLRDVTILNANYDTEKALEKRMKIRMQSTIVVFMGKQEVARSAGVTDPADLKSTLLFGM